MNKKHFYLYAMFAALLLVSCDSSKRIRTDFNYFQKGLDSLESITYKEPTIIVGDNLSVQVIAGAMNQQDAVVFNLPNGGSSSAASSSVVGLGYGTVLNNTGYQVANDGSIEIPKLGKVKALGYTKAQLAENITKLLKDGGHVIAPVVTVKFLQFKINVLGEVKKPGVVIFKSDKANVLEALAEAGDMTDYAKREDVVVMRKVDDKWESYKINLLNTKFFQSPAFYLKNNDFIYVGANDIKLKQINIDPNVQKDISLAATTLQTLFFLIQSIVILKNFK